MQALFDIRTTLDARLSPGCILAAGATVLFVCLLWVSSEIESVRSVSPWGTIRGTP